MREIYKPTPQELQDIRLKRDTFKVSGDSIFYTLQGEGISTGQPAVFLRLHYCNLHCGNPDGWKCDAWYTWDKETKEYWTEGKDLSIEETAKQIEQAWLPQQTQKRIVITGGEPLIQQKNIEELIDRLGEDWEIEIETNGTIMPSEKLLKKCQFNCSPKLSNSGNSRKASIRPRILRTLAEHNTYFKFVVSEQKDVEEMEKDFIQGVGLPYEKIILMPEGIDIESLNSHSQNVAEYAKEKGYRLMGRLQINLWGNQRGT